MPAKDCKTPCVDITNREISHGNEFDYYSEDEDMNNTVNEKFGKKRRQKQVSSCSDIQLFIRDIRDRQCGRKQSVTVRSWSTIKDVKDKINKLMHIPLGSQKLYYFGKGFPTASHSNCGKELPNHRTLHDAGIDRSGRTLLLDIRSSGIASSSNPAALGEIYVSPSMIDSTPKHLKQAVQQARSGFVLGIKPELTLDGSGGTYFLHDARKAGVGVFKPADEEPYAENNPRGYLPQHKDTTNRTVEAAAAREGIQPGELCIREVAAYLLDHDGFSSVPATTLVEARHPAFHTNHSSHGNEESLENTGADIFGASTFGSSPSIFHKSSSCCSLSNLAAGSATTTRVANKNMNDASSKKIGSFQEFCRSDCTMDDISPSLVSIDEVHKIAILDIRIMNADRNGSNLLVCHRNNHDEDEEDKNSIQLVPIDHGYCLRSAADVSWMDWCWLDWPQLKKPLSDRTRSYVLGLDVEADARMLMKKLPGIPQAAIDRFRASSQFLVAGVRAGLTLYDIACSNCRNDDLGELPSGLERLFSMASELAFSAVENGRWHHSAASRAIIDHLQRENDTSDGIGNGSSSSATMGTNINSNTHNSNNSNKSLKIRKSASTMTLDACQLLSGSGGPLNPRQWFIDSINAGDKIPSMAMSSVSDYSASELEEEDCIADGFVTDTETTTEILFTTEVKNEETARDQEDCIEWAAAIVADAGLENKNMVINNGEVSNSGKKRFPNATKRSRSYSIDSLDSDESPKGFWCTHPNSATTETWGNNFVTDDEDDDEEVSIGSNDLSSSLPEVLQLNGIKKDNDICFNTPPKSSFGVSFDIFHQSNPCIVEGVYKQTIRTNSKDNNNLSKILPLTPKSSWIGNSSNGNAMSRSKSYSALSAVNNSGNSNMMSGLSSKHFSGPSTTSKATKQFEMTEEYSEYRDYFLKFIDLVIVRETSAAATTKLVIAK